jgi:hypothetical protein
MRALEGVFTIAGPGRFLTSTETVGFSSLSSLSSLSSQFFHKAM